MLKVRAAAGFHQFKELGPEPGPGQHIESHGRLLGSPRGGALDQLVRILGVPANKLAANNDII